jgi:hypothetical protein
LLVKIWLLIAIACLPFYCTPQYTAVGCAFGDLIGRVTLNTLDNESGTVCPSGTLGYSDYTAETDPQFTTTLLPSSSYNCVVYPGQYLAVFAAWIDYNDDGIFDISERIGFTPNPIAGSGTPGVIGAAASFPISLSCNPPAGTHRLRVRAAYTDINTNLTGDQIDPCALAGLWTGDGEYYGEAEDYLITILPPPACPAPGLATSIAVATTNDEATITFDLGCSSATNFDFEYGVAGFTQGSGMLLSNQSVTINGTEASYTLTGLMANENYQVYYRANCGAEQSAWSIANAFQTGCNPISLVNIGDQSACGAYALPAIAEVTPSGNANMTLTYYDAPNGTGTILPASLTSTTTVYAYAQAGLCTAEEFFTVTVSGAAVAVSASSDAVGNEICEGGTITLTGSGADTYVWNNGVVDGQSFQIFNTTTFTVTGTDALNCSGTANITITVNLAPIVTIATDAINNGVCADDNLITLTATGNAVSYNWAGSVVDGVAFALTATETFSVTGIGANSCETTASITIDYNELPTVTASSDATNDAICLGDDVVLTGGGATTYTWNNGAENGVAFTPSINQTYEVTGTDANGCSNTSTITVTVNSIPVVTASSNATNDEVCEGDEVILTASGASTYVWNNGVVNGVAFAPTTTDVYEVTGTSTEGCSSTAAITISVNAAPTVTASSDATNDAVCADANTVTLTAGGDAVSYVWLNGVTDGVSFTLTATDTYTVTGTGANGCTADATITLTLNQLPAVTASSDATNDAICLGEAVTLVGGGATTYGWNNGVTDGSAITPSITTTYEVTGTDVNGCSNTATITITVNAIPTASIDALPTLVCFDAADITLAGSPANGTFAGTGVSGTTFSPSTATAGTYTITYTVTENGCTDIASADITVDNCAGLEELESGIIELYPNPTSGLFTLTIANSNYATVSISVVDMHGKIVYNNQSIGLAKELVQVINLSDLAKGMYFVQMNFGSETRIEKLIIH